MTNTNNFGNKVLVQMPKETTVNVLYLAKSSILLYAMLICIKIVTLRNKLIQIHANLFKKLISAKYPTRQI